MQYLRLLKKNATYRRLYLTQLVSFFGTMVSSVALPYQIYHETHSTMMVGLLSLCQLVPLLFAALFGGVLADQQHRNYLLVGANIFSTIGSLLLLWNASLQHAHVWLLFVISPFMFAVFGILRPASMSIQQQIIDKEDSGSVGALMGLSYSFGSLLGPAVGGLIIAHFGLLSAYAVDFASFIFSLFMVARLPSFGKSGNAKDQSTFAALKESFQYARSRQDLLGTYFVDFFAMIFGMPMALFPAIAHAHGHEAEILGLLYAAPAAGTALISLSSDWVNRVSRHGAAISISATLWGIAIILFGLTTQYIWVALFFLACAGAADGVSGIFRQMIWNQTIPNELRGRMSSLEMISYLSGPKLGDTEAGLVAGVFGVTASIVSGGMLCVATVGVCCYFLPKFWNYRYNNTAGNI